MEARPSLCCERPPSAATVQTTDPCCRLDYSQVLHLGNRQWCGITLPPDCRGGGSNSVATSRRKSPRCSTAAPPHCRKDVGVAGKLGAPSGTLPLASLGNLELNGWFSVSRLQGGRPKQGNGRRAPTKAHLRRPLMPCLKSRLGTGAQRPPAL